MNDVDFPHLLSAAALLESSNRPASAQVLRMSAHGKLKQAFNQSNSKHSASFISLPASSSQEKLYSILTSLAATLPRSNGAAIAQTIPLNVGIITDVYMYNFYKDVFSNIVYLSPENYKRSFDQNQFDVVIYVSCWKGLANEEWRGINYREKPANAFLEIIRLAKSKKATTVFQSIEDPSNFENFLPIARHFDAVFTSDAECVNRYRTELGHDRVFYGEYGVNPLLHNPVGCRTHVLNAALFAGSWAQRYQERCDDMLTIFSSIKKCGAPLVIVDRNYGTSAEELQYPNEYLGNVLPSVDHELLQLLHKIFRHNINLNSIKGSSTMCAMRVYELQAMGVGMISNYARSVFNKFPEIRLIPFPCDLTSDFDEKETHYEYQNNMRRLRNVMTSKTAYDVTARALTCAGIEFTRPQPPRVAIIVNPLEPDSVAQAELQTYENCVILSGDCASLDHNAKFDYFTWFDPDCTYGSAYIQDFINALKYTDTRFITKHAWFCESGYTGGPQHEFTYSVGGRARTLFCARTFRPCHFAELGFHELVALDELGYAIDPFEIRKSRSCSLPAKQNPEKYCLSVIVPVFNNGRFLVSKCIDSLKRNTIWPAMEVILVDDGSTEKDTVEAVNNLISIHDNVRGYFFGDGGSGTASRARNKGVELANARLISFLDPDNEISPRGYDSLVDIFNSASIDNDDVDFVSGFHVKVEETSKVIGKHAGRRIRKESDLKGLFLSNGKFPVIATQPAVIRRDLFKRYPLRFVEGAAGQDTLFGWELLCYARSGIFTDAANIIYYAQRDGSMVNDIDRRYFSKKLLLEKAQVDFLRREKLTEVYVDKVFQRYIDGWYAPKLACVSDTNEREACQVILDKIVSLYKENVEKTTLESAK